MRIIRNLEIFNRLLADLIESKREFTLEETNSTKIIRYPGNKKDGAIFRNRLDDDEMKHLWVFAAIKNSFMKYVKNNPGYRIYKPKQSILVDHDRLSNMKIGQTFYATDAKHCYLRCAYLLGYISETLYKKLAIPDSDMKLLRNKAMACVCSNKRVTPYSTDGMGQRKQIGNEFLKEIYYNIRNYAHQSIAKIAKATEDGFIKYKIDCVYYDPKYKEAVESAFKKRNLLFETAECCYIGKGLYVDFLKNDVFKL